MGFLRQNRDGTTSLKILVSTENDLPERVISLGAFTGKLQQGTGQLQVTFLFGCTFRAIDLFMVS